MYQYYQQCIQICSFWCDAYILNIRASEILRSILWYMQVGIEQGWAESAFFHFRKTCQQKIFLISFGQSITQVWGLGIGPLFFLFLGRIKVVESLGFSPFLELGKKLTQKRSKHDPSLEQDFHFSLTEYTYYIFSYTPAIFLFIVNCLELSGAAGQQVNINTRHFFFKRAFGLRLRFTMCVFGQKYIKF